MLQQRVDELQKQELKQKTDGEAKQNPIDELLGEVAKPIQIEELQKGEECFDERFASYDHQGLDEEVYFRPWRWPRPASSMPSSPTAVEDDESSKECKNVGVLVCSEGAVGGATRFALPAEVSVARSTAADAHLIVAKEEKGKVGSGRSAQSPGAEELEAATDQIGFDADHEVQCCCLTCMRGGAIGHAGGGSQGTLLNSVIKRRPSLVCEKKKQGCVGPTR